jgi:hypothetical protein
MTQFFIALPFNHADMPIQAAPKLGAAYRLIGAPSPFFDVGFLKAVEKSMPS